MQNESGAVVATENLSRAFGRRKAVDEVTLSVNAGNTLALFGPNGAGKTTLLRVLSGLLKPTSGSARIGATNLPGGPAIRRTVGVISHHTLLYEALTARENVEFTARLYGVRDYRDATERALDRMRILDRADSPVRALSRGLRQRVSIARATVHDPHVILADEPFTGLDLLGAAALSDLLNDLRKQGAAVFLVTHNVDEGVALATQAAIMNRGRIVAMETTASIDKATFGDRYRELVSKDV
ncbi:MAG TPA: ABC transporter ATP-binding protein [Gemmatimonadaceae bacterium]|nr:ABC transporter ATP-binding protein [Gemmatimonadaceae bacterium]